MDELVEWLRLQLDADQQLAELQPPWPWRLNAEGDEVWAADDELVAEAFALSSNQQRNTAQFIANRDPSRVLREVEAKRKILDEIVPAANGLDVDLDIQFATEPRDQAADPYLGDRLLRLLALPYSDRPGYRSEWSP